jgi:hypothetical protein
MDEPDEKIEPIEPEHPEIARIPADVKRDIEYARLFGCLLTLAAQRLKFRAGMPIESVCDGIIAAAGDRLVTPLEYRVAWLLRFGSVT